MAKRGRLEGVDRISSLPDEILCHILSFLSTKEAVRTSVLSTRWRHLFASASVCVSNLNLELDDQYDQDDLCCKRSRSGANVKSFLRFGNRVLLQNRMASIEKLRLKCGEGIKPSCVYDWISAALRQGVQHLDLQIDIPPFHKLPTVLFTCKTLVTLKLEIEFHLDIPNDVCLPRLKTLHLKSVEFSSGDSIERLFSSCESLEDLVIEHCDRNRFTYLSVSHRLLTVLFTCKTLVTLKLEIKISLHVPNDVCLPMLKNLHLKSIDFRNNDSIERLFSSCESLEDLVIEHCDIASLTELNVSHQFLKRLTILSHNVGAELDIVIDAPSLVYFKYAGFVVRKFELLNLLSLVRADVNFYLGGQPTCGCYGDRLTKFFKGIRNVQSLDLSSRSLQIYYDHAPWYNTDNWGRGFTNLLLKHPPRLEKLVFYEELFISAELPKELPPSLNRNLKEIEIFDFQATNESIEKVMYFLRNTIHLENMSVRLDDCNFRGEKIVGAAETMASPCQPKSCSILDLFMDWTSRSGP